jgi:hypothetical protein
MFLVQILTTPVDDLDEPIDLHYYSMDEPERGQLVAKVNPWFVISTIFVRNAGCNLYA